MKLVSLDPSYCGMTNIVGNFGKNHQQANRKGTQVKRV